MHDHPSTTSPPKQSASPDAVIDRLFMVMHTMYGRAWADLWQGVPLEAVKAEWARSLHGFDVNTVRLAIESMKTEGRAFPPSLPEFVALCRQFVPVGAHRLALASPRYQAPENVFANLKRQLAQKKP